jgi:hypothetical protein
MLKVSDCRCETCLKHGEILKGDTDCRNHSPADNDVHYFPLTRNDLWCCQGLWRDINGRIWTWEQVAKAGNPDVD